MIRHTADNHDFPPCRASGSTSNDCLNCSIRQLTFCGGLDPAELEYLERIVTHKHVARGNQLFEENQPADYVYNLVEGATRLVKLLPDGRRQIVGFALPGDFIGLTSRNRNSYTAEAVVDASVCRFKRDELAALLRQFPQLEHRLLGLASDALAAAQDQMLLLGRKAPLEKVASFLLTLSKRLQRLGRPAASVDLPMTRADIADFLGLTIETVSRSFTKLKKAHVIALPTPDRVQILEPDRLAALARGNSL
jgi:CRP/FNR family transcriptional regulator